MFAAKNGIDVHNYTEGSDLSFDMGPIVYEYIKKNPEECRKISEGLWTKELCNLVMTKGTRYYEAIPDELKDFGMTVMYLDDKPHPDKVKYVPESMYNTDDIKEGRLVIELMFKCDGMMIENENIPYSMLMSPAICGSNMWNCSEKQSKSDSTCPY
jgi:hypothetical protein